MGPSVPTGSQVLNLEVQDDNGDVWKMTSSSQTRFLTGHTEFRSLTNITKNDVAKNTTEFANEFADVTNLAIASSTLKYNPEQTKPATGSFSAFAISTSDNLFDLDWSSSEDKLRIVGPSIATTPSIVTGTNDYYFKVTDDDGVVWTFKSAEQTKFGGSLELKTVTEITRNGWSSTLDEMGQGTYAFADVSNRGTGAPQVEYR